MIVSRLLMITHRVLGTVLLGVNEQVNCSDCVSAFGSAGSFSAGIHGRKELTPNLSLLAGIAYTQYSEASTAASDCASITDEQRMAVSVHPL